MTIETAYGEAQARPDGAGLPEACREVLAATRVLAGARLADTVVHGVPEALVGDGSPIRHAEIVLRGEQSAHDGVPVADAPGAVSIPLLSTDEDLIGYLHVVPDHDQFGTRDLQLLRALAADVARTLSSVCEFTTALNWLDGSGTATRAGSAPTTAHFQRTGKPNA